MKPRMRSRVKPLPDWVEPMLAVLTDERFSDRGWIFEPKLDGIRCLAFVQAGSVRLLSRNRKVLDDAYPEIVATLTALGHDAVLDGEIVALDAGVSSFQRLQQRSGLRGSEAAASRVRVHYYVFDITHLDGRDLRPLPLIERRALVRSLVPRSGPVRVTPARRGAGEAAYEVACRRGLEGVIAKRAAAPYLGGRSGDWLKFKCINEQEFVVGGYTDPQGSRSGLGALLVGYHEKGALRFAGKVGTGFGARTLTELTARLARLRRATSPFSDYRRVSPSIHWVRPALVVQLGFQEWTADGRLRQARFLGIREDKRAADVIRERPRTG
jgi:bifunctional non-homologous end joining protein LigD